MENLPLYVYIVFCTTVLIGVLIFYKATHYAKPFFIQIAVWIVFQTVLSLAGFYKTANTIPPRFPLLILPPLMLLIVRFNTIRGKAFIDSLDIKALTLFSIIRIPIEIVLFWLFTHKAVPELMTFEGRNFDILSGLSAPIIYYFAFVKRKIGKNILLVWNVICLGLLMNIVVNALLSTPSYIQQFGLEQPNIAIAYFPFVLLPACLVPLAILSHVASMRQIILGKLNL